MKRKEKLLILLSILTTVSKSEIIYPPNSIDEYEVMDSTITNQKIRDESWRLTDKNMKGLEFTELDIDSNLIDENAYDPTLNIYRGPIYLDEGIIYNIVDPISVDFKLDIKTFNRAYLNSMNKLEEPITFYTYTNFKDEIKSYEIIIFDRDDKNMLDPYVILKGESLNLQEGISWSGESDKINSLSSKNELAYVLRVYDESGEYDETKPRYIKLEKNIFGKVRSEKAIENLKNSVYGESNIGVENIVIPGSEIKFYGREIPPGTIIKINNQEVEVDNRGNFIYENISNQEKKIYTVETVIGDEKEEYSVEVVTPKDYEYLVGLADFVYGKNSISGNDAILRNNPDFQSDYYNTGRLAGYYKAIKGKYEITAQVDTWSKEIKHMFSDFHERDTDSILRKIDKEYDTFDYGDGSEIYSDVDTQGKAYLRVDWDKSQVLWGNYETGFDKGMYTQYNRTLYGGRGEYNSIKTNPYGESRYQLAAFASNPDTSYKRDRFLGTGGSVYYLSERDIVVGSAKLTIEIRSKETGRLIARETLSEGQDYIINELTGRIILNEPLSQMSFIEASDDIIKDTPSSSYNSYLITDYEYYLEGDDTSNLVSGVRGKSWLTDNIGVGGTYVKESRDDDVSDYELKSAEVTFRKSEGTFIKGEFSQSEGNQLTKDSNWASYNGGYDFIEQPTIEEDIQGDAYYLEGRVAFMDYMENVSPSDNITFWYSNKDKGFSTASETSGIEKYEYGVKIEHEVQENLDIYLKGKKYEESSFDENGVKDGYKEEKKLSLGGEYQVNEKLQVGLEGQYLESKDDDSELVTLDNNNLDNGKAFLLGTKISYEFTERFEAYTKLQSSLWREDGYEANNLVTVGSIIKVTDKLETAMGYSTGNRGNAADVKVSYQYTPDYEIYTGYHFEDEKSEDLDTNLTFGQRLTYTDSTELYQESSLVDNSSEKGLLQTFGADYSYNSNWTIGLLYQMGDVEISEGDIERHTVATSLRYESRKLYSKHKLEYGRDTGARDSDIWGTINKVKWMPTPEYTFFGEANYLIAEGDLQTIKLDSDGNQYRNRNPNDNKYYEFGLGFAYRPVFNDRLNLISRWNYIYDVYGSGAVDSPTAFSEKAHIFSFETIYDFTQRLNVAGKYAIRKDEVRLASGGDWYENTMNLYAIRFNYEIIYQWDIFAEYHWLENREDSEVKHGAILGLYRDLTENFQVGVGYNFSDFSDDLTDLDYTNGGRDLDYNSQGWFINFIGKF